MWRSWSGDGLAVGRIIRGMGVSGDGLTIGRVIKGEGLVGR